MKRTVILVLQILTYCTVCAQSADELNETSKKYLQKGDFKSAVPLLKKAADMGHREAQYNLAYSYQQGIEVPKSDSIANDWLLKSASQGWKDAQFKIAYSYATGRGIPQNDREALRWSLLCAEQNDPECAYNVIGCYTDGRGTPKNEDSALYWIRRLALLENPEDLQQSGFITSARLELAKRNRAVNPTESYAWFLLYNESKRDFSVLEQQTQIDAIKELQKQLSDKQKADALRNAEDWMKRKLVNTHRLLEADL